MAREARAALAEALRELRELSQGIYPSALPERRLEAALSDLHGRRAFPLALEVSLGGRLP